MNETEKDSQEFYEELDDSKISGQVSPFSLWSFILFWSILFVIGLILIIKYGS